MCLTCCMFLVFYWEETFIFLNIILCTTFLFGTVVVLDTVSIESIDGQPNV